jgi:hypothetical protein
MNNKRYKLRLKSNEPFYHREEDEIESSVSPRTQTVIPGDFNGDGVVDGADLGLFLAGWGFPGVTDMNGDGITNGADLGLLLSNWGSTEAPIKESDLDLSAVPEKDHGYVIATLIEAGVVDGGGKDKDSERSGSPYSFGRGTSFGGAPGGGPGVGS